MSNNSPLSWTGDNCADVSTHLDNARNVAGTLMAVDGLKDLDSLPDGAVCTLMIMLDKELREAIEILKQGGAS